MTSSELACPGCLCVLLEPFVECNVCRDLYLCLQCFSRGVEVGNHESDHDYAILSNKFPLRPNSDWTAREELALLGAIEDHGLGNWCDVSNQVRTKPAAECCRHYIENFIEKPFSPELEFHIPKKERLEVMPSFHQSKPAVKKVCIDPPRPALGSQQSNDMAGYLPWRGEFQVEYDDNGDFVLQDMSFDDIDTPLERELNLAVIDIYQSTLEERAYRKRVLRDYGLLSWKNHRVHSLKLVSPGRDIQHILRPFMRLHSPEEHDKLLQCTAYELKLKEEVCRLQEYRTAGIRNLKGADLYEQLKSKRYHTVRKHTAMDNILSTIDMQTKNWAMSSNSGLEVVPRGRKPVRRLDISAAPGVGILSDEERELCSSLRLLPLAYQKHKAILIQESERLGGLKLADARRFVHIDVNKTRKLFDYFTDQGWIRDLPP